MEILKEFKKYLEENYDCSGRDNTILAYMTDVNQFLKYFKEKFEEDIVDFSNADYFECKKYIS